MDRTRASLYSRSIPTKPFLCALKGETVMPLPVWLMRQAGRYLPEYRRVRAKADSFLKLCYTPDLAMEATLQPIHRYALDAAILFSDILVIPDALGQQVVFHEGKGPILDRLESEMDMASLSLNRLASHLAPVYETVHRVAEALPPTTALIGFAGAPWTVATYMIEGGSSKDFARAKSWVLEGKRLTRLVELLIEATAQHLLAQIAAGAEAVQIFETWAGVLPEDEFHHWVTEPVAAIAAAVHRVYPDVPVIAFPRGAGVHYETFIAKAGVQAVSVDSSIPLKWIAERLQPRVTVQGSLDPSVLVAGGESMCRRVYSIADALGHGPFIFNLGHGVAPETPPEHVTQLVKSVRTWSPIDF